MPTFELTTEALRDWNKLTPQQRKRFRAAIAKFVSDLKAKRPVHASLGIERFEGHGGVFEFHFEGDGRALFRYGSEIIPGEAHIIWIRVGSHKVYKS